MGELCLKLPSWDEIKALSHRQSHVRQGRRTVEGGVGTGSCQATFVSFLIQSGCSQRGGSNKKIPTHSRAARVALAPSTEARRTQGPGGASLVSSMSALPMPTVGDSQRDPSYSTARSHSMVQKEESSSGRIILKALR